MPTYTQANRPMRIATPLGEDVVMIRGFSGEEGISRLFTFTLDLFAEKTANVTFDRILGQKVTVSFVLPGKQERHFNGIIRRISRSARGEEFIHYTAEMVPQFWLLTKRTQSRIFQHMTVPDILKKVLEGVDTSFEIQGTFEPREFCVQYRETDYDFACRLMEEEGIFYFFKHTADGHKMVLANTPQSHQDHPFASKIVYEEVVGESREEMRITGWEKVQELRSGKTTLWDHSFELPHKHLEADQPTRDSVQIGKETHKLKLGANDKLELYDWPGAYAKRFDGIDKSGGEQPDRLTKIFEDNKRTVAIRQQQEECPALLIRGVSDCRHLNPGFKFTLDRHFSDNGTYVVTWLKHEGMQGEMFRSSQEPGELKYKNEFHCIPLAHPFRPPRVTPRPVVHGTQTAVVVGPSGEEIFTDKYGRVKVQFHWDRDGKNDADSSCWVRVATNWAGKQWGMISIPRIGQEVVVGFLEGDPDQPIIVGSVYNADMMPPYTLPDNKTQSGVKTRSSKGGGPANYNEIRFEDLKGKELLTVHAEKDKVEEVENDSSEWIGRDRFLIVKRDQFELVERDKHATVKGEYREKISQDFSHQVGQKRQDKVGTNYALEAGQEIHLKAGMKVIIEGGVQVTMKVGGNFVDIGPAGVTIVGTMVKINSGGAAGSGSGSSPQDPKVPGEDQPVPGSSGPGASPSAGPGSTTGLPSSAQGAGGGGGLLAGLGAAAASLFAKLGQIAKDIYHRVFGERYSDGIVIKGPKEYREKVKARLDALKKTESGKKILEKLDAQGKAGKGVTIEPAEPGDNHCRADDISKAKPKKAAVNPATGRVDVTEKGEGTGSTVGFNPDYEPKYPDGTSCRSPEVGLGHELVHATHNGDGTNLRDFADGTDPGTAPKPSNHEEAQTIGRGAYAGDSPTDNSLRQELGFKPRTSHASVCP